VFDIIDPRSNHEVCLLVTEVLMAHYYQADDNECDDEEDNIKFLLQREPECLPLKFC
jgi:hypothetical protein